MTDDEINIAIAKTTGDIIIKGDWTTEEIIQCGAIREIKRYCNNLNAMHEAEKYLDDEQWLEYMLNLQDVLCRNPDRSKWTVCRENMSATAHQRAEAFLRTLNLWTE